MGYQDRDYFRNTQYPYWELIRSTRVCWGIVIVHTLLYLAVLMTQRSEYPLAAYLQLDPAGMIQEWQWYRLITANFVADNWWHFIFALMLIWLMGHELEQQHGSREFLAFFVVCTILGNLFQTLAWHYLPTHRFMLHVGPASAALAVMLLGVLLDPYRVVNYLLLPMQVWVVGLLAALLEFFFFLESVPWPVAVATHAGTLAFTTVYYHYNWRLAGPWTGRRLTRRATARRQLAPVLSANPKPEVVQEDTQEPASVAAARSVDEQLEAKMDAILEKVSKSGMNSLTPEEKSILNHASEVLRRKRH